MYNSKSPPVNLDKYLEGKKHHYISYEAGARKYGMAYWSFVRLCQEIGANIPLRKTSIVDMDIVEKYIESNCQLDMPREDMEGEEIMPKSRKPVENLQELVKEGKMALCQDLAQIKMRNFPFSLQVPSHSQPTHHRTYVRNRRATCNHSDCEF